MQSTPSLPLLPVRLWTGMVAPDWALSKGWIELTAYLCETELFELELFDKMEWLEIVFLTFKQDLYLNCMLMLNRIVWNGIVFDIESVIVIFWPSTRPKNAIQRWYTGRKWHIPMASNRKRLRGRIKAYEMGQGEGPTMPLQWCTGREWPVNCMTVISAWSRLNIRFQRSSGRSCGRWLII